MKRSFVILLIAAILFLQGYGIAAVATASCCPKKQCNCSSSVCCPGGKCICPGETCCVDGQCKCKTEAGCKSCKCA